MADTDASARLRLLVAAILALSLIMLVIHVAMVRPFLWPAGAGLAVSGDTVFTSHSEPRAVPQIRPPDLKDVMNGAIVATAVWPDGVAARAGLSPGVAVHAMPADPAAALTTWREAYRRGPAAPITFNERDTGRSFALTPVPVWRTSADARGAWMRQHLGPLAQMAGFLAGAVILVALGSRGMTGALMTLALVATAIANGGPMYGAELSVPLIGPLLLIVSWLMTPLSFPVIGLAVLHFPSRAEILDRHRWIYGAMAAAVAPMLVISLVAALFLLGGDVALAPLAWLATHGWLFDASFAIALATNVLIVIEGIGRYRHNLDANERRRIQIVVYTGVPAVFAYAIKAGVPLLSSLAGRRMELPWPIEAFLQAIVLLPALALPYAVAVKHVLSPRTVLRRGLQYALARRTLSVLVALPVAALLVALASDRDRPLGAIILGQPLFYLVCVGLAAAGFRYRDQAQRWLDLRFFRAEYDAREILVSLANRVPYENDPTQLVALVLSQIDNAIHPESLAVLAGEDETLHIVGGLRSMVEQLPRESGLATVLRWSDQPLEIFLDDERSQAARLPSSDRAWLAGGGVALLVPIFAGSGEARALVGLIALGQKRSEEPYTAEDRKLLSGIAAQMSVALDLSRLRKQASTGVRTAPTLTPTMVAATGNFAAPSLAMCPVCQRCFDLHDVRAADGTVVCPDDAMMLQPVIGMPPVVDGKYRVDAVIGRGGMGAVFRARDLRLERDVAIKIVRAELVADPDSRARFQREAQIVARLQHPAIVTVFDYGNLPDGAAFLVMEYVRGEDLRHLLKRERRLSAERTVELLSGIAAGVEAAHQAGVWHRDLKPENVLLPANGTGPKVLDFGVAKMTDATAGHVAAGATLTHAGATIVGTPAYMAPEQLRGDMIDGRADVYSLAVLTFEALTGRLPFGGGSFIDIGMKQSEGASTVDVAGLPEALAPTLLAALSLSRDERPAGAGAFADALMRSLRRAQP